MAQPERRELAEPRIGLGEVWIVDEDTAWRVWCMDCGYRIGTTSAPFEEAREYDAWRLTYEHQKTMHL